MQLLTPFSLPGQTAEEDVTHTARQWIKAAIEKFEKGPSLVVNSDAPSGAPEMLAILNVAAQRLLMAGDYKGVLAFKDQYNKTPSPDLADILSWAYAMQGLALAAQAEAKTGKEAEALFKLAGEKYQEALKIKPDMHEALYNWGSALLYQVRTTTGEEVETLFDLAKAKLLEAEKIKPGSGSYNLACWHALRADEKGCQEWLAKSKELGTLPDRAHLLADLDLESVRCKDWFKMFINGKQAP